jgi:hypothetical protein
VQTGRCSRAGVALALAAVVGCTGKGQATVGEALIPQADGVIEAEPGDTLEVTDADQVIEAIPDGPVVRLGIDRNVPWHRVAELVEWVTAEGKKPVLLVGRRSKIKAFVLSDELVGDPITVTTTTDGKACVQPPGSPEAKCVQRGDKIHISRAYTRELVREAMRAYRLTDVEVILPPELGWGDVVRALDGARTCCADTTMRVRIKGFPAGS